MKTNSLATLIIASTVVIFSGISIADSDRYEYGSKRGNSGVAPVNNQLYKDECAACHFAYQPGLLPERSWRKMMDNLADHFGENAELDDADRQALTEYLATNAADHSNYRRLVKFMRSIRRSETPERIIDVSYFKSKHREVPRRVLKKVSLSNCQQCHTKADTGSYSEREIDIPGYGRWED